MNIIGYYKGIYKLRCEKCDSLIEVKEVNCFAKFGHLHSKLPITCTCGNCTFDLDEESQPALSNEPYIFQFHAISYTNFICPKCRAEHKIDRQNIMQTTHENSVSIFMLDSPFSCDCGFVSNHLSAVSKSVKLKIAKAKNDNVVSCPKCGSSQLTTTSKGFGVGKAVAGAVLAGPIGLLGGFLGSNRAINTCMKCGYRWQPSK